MANVIDGGVCQSDRDLKGKSGIDAMPPVAGTDKSGSAARQQRRGRWLSRVGFLLLLGAILVCGYAFGGFLRFVEDVSSLSTPQETDHADGIVVLTGGALRLESALDLLKTGHARRLLISGVNRGTTARTLSRLTGTAPSWFDCCIDIDYAALNTIGNAEMAAAWARTRGLSRLILVTSDYHMPRSLLEFDRTPDMPAIVPYPVGREDLWAEGRMPSTNGMRVLVIEYLKLLATRLRLMTGVLHASAVDARPVKGAKFASAGLPFAHPAP
ncbi:YdcF family protein [Consotaella salsifontis]|uniref:Uncharacterized SAM-binding protein YcdF, DUF218 family n=1 Tax=Consotaella salsifontis TaxID=1365950 RepID=A0A1T4RR66_9HYPH|nr:YdcF family protein [Consotaella salsifontis]SKA18480.1 Uncharacterized SAM-binding protein YcdF, DUF218 family [Consotaella salsifontis]